MDFSVEAPRLLHRIDDDEREAIAVFDRIENLGGKCLGVLARFLAACDSLWSLSNILNGLRFEVGFLQFDRIG